MSVKTICDFCREETPERFTVSTFDAKSDKSRSERDACSKCIMRAETALRQLAAGKWPYVSSRK